jgi:hypothetical protein
VIQDGFGRFATRFDKAAASHLGFFHIAAHIGNRSGWFNWKRKDKADMLCFTVIPTTTIDIGGLLFPCAGNGYVELIIVGSQTSGGVQIVQSLKHEFLSLGFPV